ncbi:MAG: ribonucleotide reductase [Proteobacteria bacterium]|nr:ribonucleotide reductase [Pseudomonadota bacterium]
MPRESLPNRRRAVTFDVKHGGATYSVGIGLYYDDRLGEVFLSGSKTGSDMDGLLADVGVLLSRSLQHGDGVEALARTMSRLGDGMTPASIIGAVLDELRQLKEAVLHGCP